LLYEESAIFLKAIGEETRLKIISYLLVDTFCVCELVEFLNMSQPSISQHLKRLRDAQIVIEEKRGKWNYYTLNKMHPQYTVLLHLISVLPPIEMKFVKENRIECGS